MADVDYAQYFDETGLKSPFYRVSLKAVVRDDEGRVLVTRESHDTYELPGGGWDHRESVDSGLRREIREELGVGVESIGDTLFVYKGRAERPHMMMRVAVEVKLDSHDFAFTQEDENENLLEARFVDRAEFLRLNWSDSEREIVQCVDKLWPNVTDAATSSPTDTVTDHDKISL